ncbi:MAG: flagellin [Bdellovibrionota bacterium]
MGLRIGTNMAALAASRALSNTSESVALSYKRLASGQRITSSGDDAAGLSISENLRTQIRSMTQAERNANDGISFAQVAEGGLSEISNVLGRLRELAIQASSDTIGDHERGYINEEVQTLVQEIDRIAQTTNFSGVKLLTGDGPKTLLEFQVGTRNDPADRIQFNTEENDVRISSIGLDGLNYENIDGARDSMDTVDTAISKVFSVRAKLGAIQNKLHATVNNLGIAKENFMLARSRIADVDMASETGELVRQNVLQAAGVAVLAQANSSPMHAIKLL